MDRIPQLGSIPTDLYGLLSKAPDYFGGLLNTSLPDVQKPDTFYTDVIYPILRDAEGGFKKDKNDRLDWNTGELGKGKLVGTNMGVTATSLSKYLNIPSSSITEKMMRDVDQETARNVFHKDYYIRYGIDKTPKSVQPVLASAVVLRPTAARAAKNARNPQDAANQAIKDFGTIPQKGKFYRKNIRGWVNRLRKAANMKPLKNLSQVYKNYPSLRPS